MWMTTPLSPEALFRSNAHATNDTFGCSARDVDVDDEQEEESEMLAEPPFPSARLPQNAQPVVSNAPDVVRTQPPSSPATHLNTLGADEL